MAANSLFSLSDLAIQVAETYGDTSDFTLAKAKKWLNRGILYYAELGMWSFQRVYGQTISTVAGTTEYTVGALKINSIYMSSPIQRTIMLIEDRRFRELYPNSNFSGVPFFWRRAGQSKVTVDAQIIGFYPIPDDVYTIKWDGIRTMDLMVNDTDDIRTVTGMPSKYVNMLIELAIAIGFKELDDAQYGEQFQECLVRLKGLYGDDQTEIEDVMVFATIDNWDSNFYQDPVLPPQFS